MRLSVAFCCGTRAMMGLAVKRDVGLVKTGDIAHRQGVTRACPMQDPDPAEVAWSGALRARRQRRVRAGLRTGSLPGDS